MSRITNKEKLEMCVGCEDNFYNGNNPYGVSRCWHFTDAKVKMRKQVGMNDVPPWTHQPVIKTLSCYHKKGYVFVDSNQER